MGWEIGAQDPDDPAVARLELAADLLLAPTGPLQRRLVREEVLAYAVSGGRDETVDPGLLRIDVQARNAEAFPAIEAVIREEIAKVAAGVDPGELDRLRTRLRYRFLSSLDDPLTVLFTVGQALRRDPDPASIDRYQAALASATADEVAAAARDALVDAHLTVVTLTPSPVSSDVATKPEDP
jgi:predicted Zn-dependent peptidase